MSAELLHQLRQELEALSPDVSAWLEAGIEEFTAGHGKKTLCAALGLRARGRSSIGYEVARAERDAALREAFDHIPVTPDVSTTGRAKALADELFQFETRKWPRVRNAGAPPDWLEPFESALFRVMQAGEQIGVPSSWRRLYGIVTK